MSKITQQKKKRKQAEKLRQMREIHGPDWGKVECENCHKMFEPEEMIYGPDPFNLEMNNDNTMVMQCIGCNNESFWDT